ncbi:MAG: imidazole glycerol phosphate synthase subunit HisH [Bryobacteraceae bacterium]
MTAIIDYGAGNLRSVQNTLNELGATYVVTNRAEEIAKADKLLLPGVGHFGQMMTAIDRLELRDPIAERVRACVPLLGICLGLQCMFESSAEAPGKEGFGFFPDMIQRFNGDVRVPHMGWDSLDMVKDSKLLKGVGQEPFTYFAHSFYAPVVDATVATCTYSVAYTAILEHDNLFGVQFHPEKSGATGLRIVKNFLDL